MSTDPRLVDLRDLSDALEESHGNAPGPDAIPAVPNAEKKEQYASQVEQLQSMFPDTDKHVLADILAKHRGNVESAMPAVLQVSDPEYKPSADEQAVQNDARFAQQLAMEGQGPFPVAHAWPARQQTWDPSQLRYSPRVVRPRGERQPAGQAPQQPAPHWTGQYRPRDPAYVPPHGHGTNGAPVYGDSFQDELIADGKKLQADLTRFTENGIAKMSSTFMNLRQKAEQAMRNLPQDSPFRLRRENMMHDGARHDWEANHHTLGHQYDQDPEPVRDGELDRLASEPPAVPSKDVPRPSKPAQKGPLWGQRYAKQAPATGISHNSANAKLSTWADVGREDDDPSGGVSKADKAKADAEKQIKEQAEGVNSKRDTAEDTEKDTSVQDSKAKEATPPEQTKDSKTTEDHAEGKASGAKEEGTEAKAAKEASDKKAKVPETKAADGKKAKGGISKAAKTGNGKENEAKSTFKEDAKTDDKVESKETDADTKPETTKSTDTSAKTPVSSAAAPADQAPSALDADDDEEYVHNPFNDED